MKILCSRFPRLAEIGHVWFSYDLDINQRKINRTLKQYLDQEITLDEFAESYTAEIKHDLNCIFRWKELHSEDPPTVFISSEYNNKTRIRKF